MENTALIIVDLQNDYFKGGKWPLEGTEKAAENAAKLLERYREKELPVIHVRHENQTNEARFFHPNSTGAKIHQSVLNTGNEPVVVKHQINSFKDTNLKEILDTINIKNILISGAMSHMCIDSLTRAANDFGYNCTVVHDACATLELEFNGIIVPATQVHAAFMAALKFIGIKVKSTNELMNELG